MTLIVAAANADNALLASDRRLTWPDGSICDDESCKLTVFACDDAKVMVAYTGTARAGKESTEDWLLRLLETSAQSSRLIADVVNQFAILASSEAPAIERHHPFRLEIVMVGYQFAWDAPPSPTIFRIYNISTPPSFTTNTCDSSSAGTMLRLAGTTSGVSHRETREIDQLLRIGTKPRGIEMKLAHVIRSSSQRTKSNGLVGAQINTCRLESQSDAPFISTYHSDYPTQAMYGVNSVLMAGGLGLVTYGPHLFVGKDLQAVSFPRARPGEKCPCRSGLKYKHCHANFRYPYLPVSSQCDLGDSRVPSGKIFTVRNYGAYGGA